jgi:hypothetical protein
MDELRIQKRGYRVTGLGLLLFSLISLIALKDGLGSPDQSFGLDRLDSCSQGLALTGTIDLPISIATLTAFKDFKTRLLDPTKLSIPKGEIPNFDSFPTQNGFTHWAIAFARAHLGDPDFIQRVLDKQHTISTQIQNLVDSVDGHSADGLRKQLQLSFEHQFLQEMLQALDGSFLPYFGQSETEVRVFLARPEIGKYALEEARWRLFLAIGKIPGGAPSDGIIQLNSEAEFYLKLVNALETKREYP